MPYSKQVTPDTAEEERDSSRPSNSNNNTENDAGIVQPVAGAAIPRRDENSISFRHFLQPHSDVVPAPAPTCRSRSREQLIGFKGTQPGGVDLVDMAMALPDFVQDHLVVESLANAEHQNDGAPSHSGASSLDLHVLNEILPDFATSQPAHSLPSQGSHPRRRNNLQDEYPAVPDASHGASGSSALPDFLSDGPMQCTDSNVVDNSLPASSSSRTASRLMSSASLTERSRMLDESSRGVSFDSSDPLRSEVDRLRREITERNRRIAQLENEVVRLRTNINSLDSALRTAEQSAVSSEARLLQVQRRSDNVKGGGDMCDNVISSNSSAVENTEVDAHTVRNIAQSSEALIGQLFRNMKLLQELANSASNQAEASGSSEKVEPDDDTAKK